MNTRDVKEEKPLAEMSVITQYEMEPLVGNVKIPNIVKDGKHNVQRKSWLSPLQKQILAVAGPISVTVSSGMTSGFTAMLIPQLQHPNSTIPISLEEATWIGSMAPFSMALGCILSGPIMQNLGRRIAIQLSCIPFVSGWIGISVANSLPIIFLGRFLTGISVGLVGPPVAVFIAEIVTPKYRGISLACISLGISSGILLSHVLGIYLQWHIAAAICSLPPVVCFIILLFVYESPTWYVSKNKFVEAKNAFFWFRGEGTEAVKEFQSMLPVSTILGETEREKVNNKWRVILRRIVHVSFLKPLFVMGIFFFVQQFSGVNTIAFYTVFILENVGSGVDKYLATVIVDIVRVFMSFVACVLLRKIGRIPLTVSSCCGTAASLFGLGLFLDYAHPEIKTTFSWVPIMLFVFYISFVNTGLIPLPWAMIGEVFPAALRELGSAATSCFCFIIFSVVVKTGPIFFTTLGPSVTFYIYGSVTLFGAVFLYIFLPETKNKTLKEIENKHIPK